MSIQSSASPTDKRTHAASGDAAAHSSGTNGSAAKKRRPDKVEENDEDKSDGELQVCMLRDL